MARSWKSSSITFKVISVVFCSVVLLYSVYDANQFVRQHQQSIVEWHQEIAALTSPTPSSEIAIGEVAGVSIASPSSDLKRFETAQFVRVVDGDTIRVKLNGKEEVVRLVGINSPESVAPQKPVECMGKEASISLTEMVQPDQMLYLERDDTQSNRDRYGRLLRFVFTADQKDIGLAQIRQGFAHSALYSSRPHKYLQEYLAAETEASATGLGLWQPGVCEE